MTTRPPRDARRAGARSPAAPAARPLPHAAPGPRVRAREPREAPRLLAVGPVTVPDALARDEWLIRTGDSGATVYDHQLWTQGLGADVAQALVDYLNRAAPLPDGLWADAGPTGSGSGADLERPAACACACRCCASTRCWRRHRPSATSCAGRSSACRRTPRWARWTPAATAWCAPPCAMPAVRRRRLARASRGAARFDQSPARIPRPCGSSPRTSPGAARECPERAKTASRR